MSSSLPIERRHIIADRLYRGQPVVAAVLATEFGVSEDAIRRDLRALATEGRCRRVYGGALPLSPASTAMADRAAENRERKLALALKALTLIEPGTLLFLDNGSTNLALASVLPADWDLTIATNSVAIAAELVTRQGVRLMMLGGIVDPHVGGCLDANAILALQQFNIDLCFLGACSISAEEGLSAFRPADAAFKRALLSASRRLIAMIATEKIGTTAPHRVTALAHLEALVLEHDAPGEMQMVLAQAGPRILLADPA